MSIGSTSTRTTARGLKQRIARLDARIAQLRAMEGGAMLARDLHLEDRLRGRIFDRGDRLAQDKIYKIEAHALELSRQRRRRGLGFTGRSPPGLRVGLGGGPPL